MAKGLKTMVTMKGAVVIRDSKRVRPQIGKAFDYSEDEIETLNTATPGTLREPITAETEPADADAATSTKKAPAKGGSKAKANAKADEDDEL